MATNNFDFSSIEGLGSFWDGTKSLQGGSSMPGGGAFNQYSGDAGINSNLDLLYQNLIGRNADPGGKAYWAKELKSGATDFGKIADAIKGSYEYKDQQSAISGGATAADLKALDSAYVSPFDIPGSTYNEYTKTGTVTKLMADEMVARNTGDPSTHLAAGIYGGSTPSAYVNTLADYTGAWDKGSKNQRADENIYQQNKLDELIRYVQQSGIGNYVQGEDSAPQWMPIGGLNADESSEHYRNQDSRAAEDLWQAGQIQDLEKWAANIVGGGQYSGLTFNPSDVYHGYGSDGTTYSTHTNEGMRRNKSQQASIQNLVDFITSLDTARGGEYAASKTAAQNTYGAGIDEIYNELFETDTGIDTAGKTYWTDELVNNVPGLAAGQNWKKWLSDAFKNTESYKMHLANKPPEQIDVGDTGGTGGTGGTGTGTGSTGVTDYATLLNNAMSQWNTSLQSTISSLSDSYKTQLADLKTSFDAANQSNADLMQSYQDSLASFQATQDAQAAYGEKTMNQSVKGVKTQNELPGYTPSTGGTGGHFSRTGHRLSTSSLNI